VNIAAVKNGNWKYVRNDIESMAVATHWRGKLLKLIIETSLLNTAEIITVCGISAELGVNYVKTSTGLLGQGATPEIVALLRSNLPKNVRIKASGGISTLAQAEALINAGATRIGTSKAMTMV
jgi:deoxyribose-phosphate aldolase